MLLNTQGIVIRTIKYGDTSVITHIFTHAKGVKSFIVNGVRTKRTTMPYGLFQPGTFLDLTMYAHDQKKLLRLKEAKIASPWQKLPFDIKRSSVSLFICELLEKTLRDSDEHGQLFDEVLLYLQHIDTTENSLANQPIFFLIDLSVHFGFGPQGRYDSGQKYFDLQEGYFMKKPHSLYYMNEINAQYFSACIETGFIDGHTISLTRALRKSILEDMIKYYSLHIENFPSLRSIEVFQSIMEI